MAPSPEDGGSSPSPRPEDVAAAEGADPGAELAGAGLPGPELAGAELAGAGLPGPALPSPVGLVGLGVMGGSLARALAALATPPEPPEIVAWSREPADVEAARAEGVVDVGVATARQVAERAALVVYAVPLDAALRLAEAHGPFLREDAVVTDVVSLKAPLVAAFREAGAAGRYVGSHPMAGSEASGFGASKADLYRGAEVWIATDTGSAEARAEVERLWAAVGARTRPIDAAEHDRRMVWASHLPQLVATALAHVLKHQGLAPDDLGPGGRDMIRLAASSPGMWLDLLEAAAPRDGRALDAMGGALHRLGRDLREGRTDEIGEIMEATRRWARGGSP